MLFGNGNFTAQHVGVGTTYSVHHRRAGQRYNEDVAVHFAYYSAIVLHSVASAVEPHAYRLAHERSYLLFYVVQVSALFQFAILPCRRNFFRSRRIRKC